MEYSIYSKTLQRSLLFLALLSASLASAQTPTELENIRFSADIHAQLPFTTPGTVRGDDDTIYVFDLTTGTADAFSEIGGQDQAGVDGYSDSAFGCSAPVAYSLDATAVVFGLVVRPADVIIGFGTKLLDARADGIPDGVNVDAISFEPETCDLVFSIDVIASLGGEVYLPDDLILWDGSNFSIFYRPGFGVNIDALHIINDTRYLFSTDADVVLGGIAFQDDDVIEDIILWPSVQVLSFAPRVFNDSWQPADLSAISATVAPQGGEFSFDRNRVETFESDGPLSITVLRENGATGDVTINWTATNGSAVHPGDFQPPSGTIVFVDTQTTGTFPIAIFNDALTEGDEEFTVELSIGSGDGSIVSPSVITITIVDDETTIFKDSFED